MAVSESITINGKRFTATRLTMRQIRDCLAEIETPGQRRGLVGRLFVDSLPEPAFYASLGIDEEQLIESGLSAEDVKELMEAVAKINPTFAASEKRLAADLQRFHDVESLKALQQSLNEIASPSLPQDSREPGTTTSRSIDEPSTR